MMQEVYMPGLSAEAQAVRNQYFSTGTIPSIGIKKWSVFTPFKDGSVSTALSSNAWKTLTPVIILGGLVAAVAFKDEIKGLLK